MAQSDYDTMDMEIHDYHVQSNRFEHGVGARIFTGWDEDSMCPTFVVPSSEDLFLDPNGWLHINNFAFFWFERKCDIDTLMEKKGKDWRYNLDEYHAYITTDQQENTENKRVVAEMSQNAQEESQASNIGTLYYHYFEREWKPVQAVCDGECRFIFNAKVIEPLLSEANKYKKIRFPISLNYFEPREWNPYGLNIYDILEDKQKMQQMLMNLMMIKATKEALWDKIFIDQSIYKTARNHLLKPTRGLQYIPVATNGAPMTNFVYTNPQNPISPDVYNMNSMLPNQAMQDIGINDQTRGIDDWKPKTATEVSTEQMNQNINLLLGKKVNSRGEKQFWKLWYIFTDFYRDDTKEKYIEINKGISTIVDKLTKKDIKLPTTPNIFIDNKSEIDAKHAKQAQQFIALLPMYLQDPTIPEVGKRFMKRKGLRLSNISKQEVELMIPLTPDEMQAKEDVMFLNKNLPLKISSMDEDHLTYLIIYQTALNTKATRAAIEGRKIAYMDSGQQNALKQQPESLWQWWIANAMWSQMMSWMMWGQQSPSAMQL